MDKGVFRIFCEVTGWKSIGSFIVSDDRLLLANDPVCQEVIGIYSWRWEREELSLAVIEDQCAIGLRAKNLTNLPWKKAEE